MEFKKKVRKNNKKIDTIKNQRSVVIFSKKNIIIFTCMLLFLSGILYYYYYYIQENHSIQSYLRLIIGGSRNHEKTNKQNIEGSSLYDISITDDNEMKFDDKDVKINEIIPATLYFFSDDLIIDGTTNSKMLNVFKFFFPDQLPNDTGKRNLYYIFKHIIYKFNLKISNNNQYEKKKIKLDNGGKFLMALDYGSSKHATSFLVYCLKKDLYHIYYCNSGNGIKFHIGKIFNNKHYTKSIYKFILNEVEYKEFMEIYKSIHPNLSRYSIEDSYILITYLNSLKFGNNFQAHRKKVFLLDNNENNVKYFTPSQTSGNCVFRAVYLLLYIVQHMIYNNEEVYLDEFINTIRLKILDFAINDIRKNKEGKNKEGKNKAVLQNFYSYHYDIYLKEFRERINDICDKGIITSIKYEKEKLKTLKEELDSLYQNKDVDFEFFNNLDVTTYRSNYTNLYNSICLNLNESFVEKLTRLNNYIKTSKNQYINNYDNNNYDLDEIELNIKKYFDMFMGDIHTMDINNKFFFDGYIASIQKLYDNLFKNYPIFFNYNIENEYDSIVINEIFKSKMYISHQYYNELQNQICELKLNTSFMAIFEIYDEINNYKYYFLRQIINIIYNNDISIKLRYDKKLGSRFIELFDIYDGFSGKHIVIRSGTVMMLSWTRLTGNYINIENFDDLNKFCQKKLIEIYKENNIYITFTESFNFGKNKDIDIDNDIIISKGTMNINERDIIKEQYHNVNDIYIKFCDITDDAKFTKEIIVNDFIDFISQIEFEYQQNYYDYHTNEKLAYNKYGILNLLFRTPDYETLNDELIKYIPIIFKTSNNSTTKNSECFYDIETLENLGICNDENDDKQLFNILYTDKILKDYENYIDKIKIPENIKFIIILHFLNTNNNNFNSLLEELEKEGISSIYKKLQSLSSINEKIRYVIEDELYFIYNKIMTSKGKKPSTNELIRAEALIHYDDKIGMNLIKKKKLMNNFFTITRSRGYVIEDEEKNIIIIDNNEYLYNDNKVQVLCKRSNLKYEYYYTDYFCFINNNTFNLSENDYLFHNFIEKIEKTKIETNSSNITKLKEILNSSNFCDLLGATDYKHILLYDDKIYYLNHDTVLQPTGTNCCYINKIDSDEPDKNNKLVYDNIEKRMLRDLYGETVGMLFYKNNDVVFLRLFVPLQNKSVVTRITHNSVDYRLTIYPYMKHYKVDPTSFKTLDIKLDHNYQLPNNITPEDINYCIQYANVHYNYNFYKYLLGYMSLNIYSYFGNNIQLNNKEINLYGRIFNGLFNNDYKTNSKSDINLSYINIIQTLPFNNILLNNINLTERLTQTPLFRWNEYPTYMKDISLPPRFKYITMSKNDIINSPEIKNGIINYFPNTRLQDIENENYYNVDYERIFDTEILKNISINVLNDVNSINICYHINKDLFIAQHFIKLDENLNLNLNYNDVSTEIEQYYLKNKKYIYDTVRDLNNDIDYVLKKIDDNLEELFKKKTEESFSILRFDSYIKEMTYFVFMKDEVLTLIAYYINLKKVYETSKKSLKDNSMKQDKNIYDNIYTDLVNSRSCYITDDPGNKSQYLLNVKSMIIWWEYFFGNLGRDDQYKIINNMIDNEGKIINTHKIYQLIMGAGKSSFIAPLLSIFIIHNYKFPIHVIPDNLITQTIQSMGKLINFGIRTIEISNPRDYDIHEIGPFNSQLRNYIISSSNYKKLILINTETDYYQFKNFTDSLKNAYVIIDEVDIVSNPFTSTLNKPLYKKRGYVAAGYDKEYMKLVFDSIVKLHFDDNGIYDIHKDFKIENILGICNTYIKNKTEFDNIDKLQNYKPHNTDNTTMTDEDKKIKLVQNMIVRLKKTQAKKNRLNFGLLEPDTGYLDNSVMVKKKISEERINKIAIPFSSNETPVKTSEFADTLLSIILTMMSHMFNTNILRYQDIYNEFNRLSTIKNNNTILFFLDHENSKKLVILEYIISIIKDKERVKITEERVRQFVFEFILNILDLNLKSSKYSQNITFSDMIQSNICKNRSGFSGTPYFICPYDYSLQKSMKLNPVEDKSSDGSIFISIINSHIIFFSGNPNSLGFLDDPYMEDKKNKLVAVIDACAYNLGIKSYEYAVSIRRKIDKDIIYLEDSGKVNQKYILSEEGISKYIDDGKRDQKSCAYFDQKNITGIDIRLNFEDTYGIILIDEKTGLRDFSQAAYRLRSLNKGQNLIIVDTSKKRTKLTKQDLIDQLKDVEKKFQENKKQHQSIDNMIALFRQYVLTEYKTLRVGKIHNRDYKFLENNIFSLKLESFENDPGKWDYTYKKFMIDFVEYLNMWLLADKEKISLKGVEILEILKKTINDYKLSDSDSSFMDVQVENETENENENENENETENENENENEIQIYNFKSIDKISFSSYIDMKIDDNDSVAPIDNIFEIKNDFINVSDSNLWISHIYLKYIHNFSIKKNSKLLYPFPLLLYNIQRKYFIIISFEEYEQWDNVTRGFFTHTIPDNFIPGYVSNTISPYLISLMLMDITSLNYKKKSGPLYLTFKAIFFKEIKINDNSYIIDFNDRNFGSQLLNLLLIQKIDPKKITINSDFEFDVQDAHSDILYWNYLNNIGFNMTTSNIKKEQN